VSHEEAPTSIAEIVAQSAGRNVDSTANTEVVIEEAVSECVALHEEGQLTDEVPGDLLEQYFRKQVKATVRSGTSFVRSALEKGQVIADLGDAYDITLTVCGPRALKSLMGMASVAGRTTTLGNLSADDIDLTIEELRLTYESQKRAYYASRETGGLWVAQLRPYAGYRAWRSAEGEASA